MKRISRARAITACERRETSDERRDQGGRSCWFGLSCLSGSSNQTNQKDQIDKIDQTNEMNQIPVTRREMGLGTFFFPSFFILQLVKG